MHIDGPELRCLSNPTMQRGFLSKYKRHRDSQGLWLSTAFGFFSFLPYPAISVGGNSGIQIGHIFVLLAVFLILWRGRVRSDYLLLCGIVIPVLMSIVSLTGRGNVEEVNSSIRSGAFFILSCSTVLAAQLLIRDDGVGVLTGIASAAIVHVLVGICQLIAFQSGSELPFVWLYDNPSFASVQSQADTIARYIRRPFGLFPEPSAMAASLSPWVMLWAANLLGLIRFRYVPTRWQRRLFAAAAVLGLLLLVTSRSGHLVVTALGLIVLVSAWSIRLPHGLLKSVGLPTLVLFVVLVAGVTVNSVAERVQDVRGYDPEQSWHMRFSSMVYGASSWLESDASVIAFGFGPGQAQFILNKGANLQAVWSVLLTYLLETGVIGLASFVFLFGHAIAVVSRSPARLVAVVFSVNWLVGVLVTTSYFQLLPVWVAFAWIFTWCDIHEDAEPAHVMRRRQKK